VCSSDLEEVIDIQHEEPKAVAAINEAIKK
jgi:hypothetical protein